MCDVARKQAISLAAAHAQWKLNSGRFDGSITASRVVNTVGAGLKLRATWLRADMCYLLVRAATQDASHTAFTPH
jgi:hypothetical protein